MAKEKYGPGFAAKGWGQTGMPDKAPNSEIPPKTGPGHFHLEAAACHRHLQVPIPAPSQTCPYNTIASHPITHHLVAQSAVPSEPQVAPAIQSDAKAADPSDPKSRADSK